MRYLLHSIIRGNIPFLFFSVRCCPKNLFFYWNEILIVLYFSYRSLSLYKKRMPIPKISLNPGSTISLFMGIKLFSNEASMHRCMIKKRWFFFGGYSPVYAREDTYNRGCCYRWNWEHKWHRKTGSETIISDLFRYLEYACR